MTNKKIAKIIPEIGFSFIDHPFRKPSLLLFFCGCYRNCKGCQSPELQNPNNSDCIEISVYQLEKILNYYLSNYNNKINSLVICGGEPLLYTDFLISLLDKIKEKYPNLEIVLYTGFKFEDISDNLKKYLDFIIDGEYREDLKTYSFPASANQRVFYKNKKTQQFQDITNQFLFLSN